jgi:LmbE family N-acetylglucosaminyl deacetylase
VKTVASRLTFAKKRPLLTVATVLLAAFILYSILLPGYAVSHMGSLSGYPTFPRLAPADRLTIVAPHLDDETIGVGGLIAQARSSGVPVSIIFMTNGDDNPLGADLQFRTGYATPRQLIESGIARQREAVAALKKLGVEESSLIFLGLPDRGLLQLQTPEHAEIAYMAPGTLKNSSPYANSYVKDLPYSGNAVRGALQKAIAFTRPTVLLTTMPEDTHTDHSATAHFVEQIMPSLGIRPRLFYFLVHFGRGYPVQSGLHVESPLVPPKQLKDRPWEVVVLSPDEVGRKQSALLQYSSQLNIPFSGKGLLRYIRKNELLEKSQ